MKNTDPTNDDLPDFDGFDEDEGYSDCPHCGRSYDEIDYDYQSCSKCGLDAAGKPTGYKRRPTNSDYLNGDADILTGRWY